VLKLSSSYHQESYRVENCTVRQVGMYVLAGVGGWATVLPVLELRVQSYYFLDQPCIRDTVGIYQLITAAQDKDCTRARFEAVIIVLMKIEVLYAV